MCVQQTHISHLYTTHDSSPHLTIKNCMDLSVHMTYTY